MEFGQEFSDLLSSYRIHKVTTTPKNPRANAILERVHGVIGDMLRTNDFEHQKLDSWAKECQDPFEGFLAAVSFAIRATYQTSIGTSPAAMVFQRDMFFPTKFVANWQTQAQNRKIQLKKGVTRENVKRLPHRYHVGDRVLVRHDMDGQPHAKMKRPTSGPYTVT
jgi:hypothetical protein